MFGRNDFIENIKDALAAAGCDMGAFRSWQKQYDRLKKNKRTERALRALPGTDEAGAGRCTADGTDAYCRTDCGSEGVWQIIKRPPADAEQF